MATSSDRIEVRLKLKGGKVMAGELKAVNYQTSQLGKHGRTASTALGLMNRAGGIARSSLMAFGRAVKYAAFGTGALAVVEIPRLINAYRESRKVSAATNQSIRKTGGIANVTAGQIADMAQTLSRKTGIDDEQIQSSSNLLLTFRNIRNEAGKNNDIFNQATSTALDMAAAYGLDLPSATKMLGKALQDPAKAASALKRTGAIDQAGVDRLAKMAENGVSILQMQKSLIDSVNKAGVEGRAAAIADPFDKLKVSIENVEETLGGLLFPVFSDIAAEADKQFKKVNAIINNPNLTGKQKWNRLSKMAEKALDKLLATVEAKLPMIANTGAKIGLKLASALGRAFLKSPWLVKLAVAGWFIGAMGGYSALARLAGRAGLTLAKSLGKKFLAAILPYFVTTETAYSLGGVLDTKITKLKTPMGGLGRKLGSALAGGMLVGAVAGIGILGTQLMEKISDELGLTNSFSLNGMTAAQAAQLPPDQLAAYQALADTFDASPEQQAILHPHHGKPPRIPSPPKSGSPRLETSPRGGRGKRSMLQPITLIMPNGKVLAEVVADTAEDFGAFA